MERKKRKRALRFKKNGLGYESASIGIDSAVIKCLEDLTGIDKKQMKFDTKLTPNGFVMKLEEISQ